jgi:hypothetical protein
MDMVRILRHLVADLSKSERLIATSSKPRLLVEIKCISKPASADHLFQNRLDSGGN